MNKDYAREMTRNSKAACPLAIRCVSFLPCYLPSSQLSPIMLSASMVEEVVFWYGGKENHKHYIVRKILLEFYSMQRKVQIGRTQMDTTTRCVIIRNKVGACITRQTVL